MRPMPPTHPPTVPPNALRTTDPAATLADRHRSAARRRRLAEATPLPLAGPRRAVATRLRELAQRLEGGALPAPLPERSA